MSLLVIRAFSLSQITFHPPWSKTYSQFSNIFTLPGSTSKILHCRRPLQPPIEPRSCPSPSTTGILSAAVNDGRLLLILYYISLLLVFVLSGFWLCPSSGSSPYIIIHSCYCYKSHPNLSISPTSNYILFLQSSALDTTTHVSLVTTTINSLKFWFLSHRYYSLFTFFTITHHLHSLFFTIRKVPNHNTCSITGKKNPRFLS